MFLSAIARPVHVEDGDRVFDEKISLWSFAERFAAMRMSRNRPKGTLDLNPVNIDKKAYKAFLLDNVIPRIFRKCPGR